MPNAMTVLNIDAHTALANELNTSRVNRVVVYWKIGRQLNLEYGRPDSNYIPGRDMEKLMDLYGVHNTTISATRRFAAHPESDTVTKSRQVASEYRSWSGIVNRFLRGLSPDALIPAQRNAQQVARGFVVPEAAVSEFAVKFGWSHAMAQRAMREYSRDTGWLVSIFETRARRDGHRPVTSG